MLIKVNLIVLDMNKFDKLFTDLLGSSNFFSINKTLVKKFNSLEIATILQEILSKISYYEELIDNHDDEIKFNKYDPQFGVQYGTVDIMEDLRLSRKAIKKHLDYLVTLELLIIVKKGVPCKSWITIHPNFRISLEKLWEVKTTFNPDGPNCPTELEEENKENEETAKLDGPNCPTRESKLPNLYSQNCPTYNIEEREKNVKNKVINKNQKLSSLEELKQINLEALEEFKTDFLKNKVNPVDLAEYQRWAGNTEFSTSQALIDLRLIFSDIETWIKELKAKKSLTANPNIGNRFKQFAKKTNIGWIKPTPNFNKKIVNVETTTPSYVRTIGKIQIKN
jgi:hypothetical protein